MGAKIQVNDVTVNPIEMVDKSGDEIKIFEDWVLLSNYVKNLMETGVINLDVISNRTLLSVILSKLSNEEYEKFVKDWRLK